MSLGGQYTQPTVGQPKPSKTIDDEHPVIWEMESKPFIMIGIIKTISRVILSSLRLGLSWATWGGVI